MDYDLTEDHCATHLITNFEAIIAKVLMQERRRWVEICKALQGKVDKLQSEVIRLNVQVQSHQLESTRRGLWLKRKAGLDGLDERPRKLSRQQDSAQDLVSPVHAPAYSNSIDTGNVAEGPDTISVHPTQLVSPGNGSGATSLDDPTSYPRPIARLPTQTREAGVPTASNEQERAVYCLCGGHEYGIMIRCDSPKCELEWFHVGCVDLEEVPGQDEEWFCPACVRSREVPKPPAPSREFASSSVQAIPAKVDSACQTDRVASRSPTPTALPLTPPQEPLSSSTLPPTGAQQHQRLLSPFAPLSITIPEPDREALQSPLFPESPGSTISALTPLSTSGRHALNTYGEGTLEHRRPQGQRLVWIALEPKLVKSAKKSLFQRLQPTGHKPWET